MVAFVKRAEALLISPMRSISEVVRVMTALGKAYTRDLRPNKKRSRSTNQMTDTTPFGAVGGNHASTGLSTAANRDRESSTPRVRGPLSRIVSLCRGTRNPGLEQSRLDALVAGALIEKGCAIVPADAREVLIEEWFAVRPSLTPHGLWIPRELMTAATNYFTSQCVQVTVLALFSEF